MIDLKSIKSLAETFTAVMGTIRAVASMMPVEKQKEIGPLILKLEAEQKLAEASLAQKLGLDLCQYCWPPEIVRASRITLRQECVKCHQQPPHLEQQERLRKLWASQQLNHNV